MQTVTVDSPPTTFAPQSQAWDELRKETKGQRSEKPPQPTSVSPQDRKPKALTALTRCRPSPPSGFFPSGPSGHGRGPQGGPRGIRGLGSEIGSEETCQGVLDQSAPGTLSPEPSRTSGGTHRRPAAPSLRSENSAGELNRQLP